MKHKQKRFALNTQARVIKYTLHGLGAGFMLMHVTYGSVGLHVKHDRFILGAVLAPKRCNCVLHKYTMQDVRSVNVEFLDLLRNQVPIVLYYGLRISTSEINLH